MTIREQRRRLRRAYLTFTAWFWDAFDDLRCEFGMHQGSNAHCSWCGRRVRP